MNETGAPVFTHCAGYAYTDEYIRAFSHTRMNGVGIADYGVVALMPTVGMTAARTTPMGHRSRYAKDERACGPRALRGHPRRGRHPRRAAPRASGPRSRATRGRPAPTRPCCSTSGTRSRMSTSSAGSVTVHPRGPRDSRASCGSREATRGASAGWTCTTWRASIATSPRTACGRRACSSRARPRGTAPTPARGRASTPRPIATSRSRSASRSSTSRAPA